MKIAGYKFNFDLNAPYYISCVEMSPEEIQEGRQARSQYHNNREQLVSEYRNGMISKAEYKAFKKAPKHDYKQQKREISYKYDHMNDDTGLMGSSFVDDSDSE